MSALTISILFWGITIYLVLCIIAKTCIELVEDALVRMGIRNDLPAGTRLSLWGSRMPMIWFPVFHIFVIAKCAHMYVEGYIKSLEKYTENEDTRIINE